MSLFCFGLQNQFSSVIGVHQARVYMHRSTYIVVISRYWNRTVRAW